MPHRRKQVYLLVDVAELGRDMIKSPDHELEAWLGLMALAANG